MPSASLLLIAALLALPMPSRPSPPIQGRPPVLDTSRSGYRYRKLMERLFHRAEARL